MKDTFLEERLGDRTKKYFILKCECGNSTNGYEDKNLCIQSWNEKNFTKSFNGLEKAS